MAQESLHRIRLEAWLRSDCNCGYLPPSPPLDIKQPPPHPEQRPQTPIAYTPPSTRLKRKRAMSVPTVLSDTNTDSPIKRQRVENVSDNIGPDQSISQTDSHIQSLVLNERTTFRSPPTTGGASRTSSASPKRVTSPTRETPVMLRTASPPIVTESVHGLKDPPPPEVRTLMRRAESGVHSRFIPQELKALIDADTEIGYEIFQEEDFNNTPYQGSAEVLWGEVRTILLNARNCADGSRDENAWCMDVVQPIIQLAIRMYGKDKWWLQSVQSQYINPTYLSATRSTGIKDKCIDRKTDYVLSYSHHDPDTAQLYSRLAANNCYEISHVMDTFTKRTALFSGLEIKPSYGSRAEAELQMSIWIAASIRKKMEMASLVGVDLIPASLAEPALTIVGHEHRISYAYPSTDLGEGGVRVLGSSLLLSTVSVRGVFQLLRLYRNLLEYGMDKSDDGYWGGVLGKVLESLASGDGV